MVDIIEISKCSSPASSTSSGPFSFAPVSNPYNSATRKRIKKRVEMQSIELLDDKSEATSTFQDDSKGSPTNNSGNRNHVEYTDDNDNEDYSLSSSSSDTSIDKSKDSISVDSGDSQSGCSEHPGDDGSDDKMDKHAYNSVETDFGDGNAYEPIPSVGIHKGNSTNSSIHPIAKEITSFPKRTAPFIDPSLYKPPPHQENKRDPVVHQLTLNNRPLSNRRMIPVSSLFQSSISNFWKEKWHSFNHMQSELSQALVYSDDNMVVSAPTGAGKTCIFEMAMGRLFQNALDSLNRSISHKRYDSHSNIPNHRKIVYLSPSKALCQERYNDWSRRLSQINPTIECAMITGDSSESNGSIRDVASAHVILTTPEKWDSITRKWTDHLYLIGSVKLLLVDEVHLIGDKSRGACLEAIICRMKTVQRAAKARNGIAHHSSEDEERLSRSANTTPEALSSNMRLVAVSATLPNIADIASFLDAHEAYCFDSSYRPVKLTTHVVGLGYCGKNQFLFDKGLNRHVPDLIKRFSRGRPTIIFCHTKKQTETVAAELAISIGFGGNDPVLANMAQQSSVPSLQNCLRKGIAFHHAGLESENRQLVEQYFTKGLIKCLCATSTLAMGVNLPAHLVIIKGTSVWRGAGQGYQELDSGTLLQMMGRAGRPGLDDSGTAVIMTDSNSKLRYEQLSHGLNVVESMLPDALTETLNTEISQKVITNTKEAINWLKGTFFFVRVRKNAKYYRLHWKKDDDIESYLMERCLNSLRDLHESNIIDLDDQGNCVQPRKASHVMSRHIVPFDGMKAIVALPHDSGPREILQTLSNMAGIHFPVRRSEKTLLNEAHKIIKYKLEGGPPSKIRVQTSSQKSFVLLQAAIGQYFLNDYTLRQEMSLSIEFASRMLTAIEDYSVEDSKHGKVALESLMLRRNLATSLWGAGDCVLNQLRGVGAKTASKLAMNKMRTFDDILSKSSNEIEQACGRQSPFGQQLKNIVSKIKAKSLKLTAYMEGLESDSKSNELICILSSPSPDFDADTDKIENTGDSRIVTYTLSVHTDRPGGSLMFRTELSGPGTHKIKCPDKFGRIYIRLVSNLVGLDEQLNIEGNDIIEKPAFALSPKPKATKTNYHTSIKVTKSSTNNIKALEKMVDGIDDFRMMQHDSSSKTKSRKISTPASNTSHLSSKNTEKVKSPSIDPSQRFVTPSPNISNRTSFVAPESNNLKSPPIMSKRNHNFQHERTIIRDPKRCRIQHSSWQLQKKKQQKFQKRAFGSPKENPFSKFRFDPNDVESQIELESKTISDRHPEVETIIPQSLQSSMGRSNGPHFERRSRFISNGINKFKTPSKALGHNFTGSSRRGRIGIPNRQPDLLRQKAAEQQAYVSSREQNYSRIQLNYGQPEPPQHLMDTSQHHQGYHNFHSNTYYNFPTDQFSPMAPNTGTLEPYHSYYDQSTNNNQLSQNPVPTDDWNMETGPLLQNNYQYNYHQLGDHSKILQPNLAMYNSDIQLGNIEIDGIFHNENCLNVSNYQGETGLCRDPSIYNGSFSCDYAQNQAPNSMEGMIIEYGRNDDHRSNNASTFESAFF